MAAAGDAVDAVRLFYSYAHEDADLREELQGHLKILERKKLIAPWHDRRIVPGQDWNAEIDAHLRDAELVLLLVSKDFIASDYIMGKELTAAMAQHESGTSTVVPICVRPVDLQPEDVDVAPFLKLQGLPPEFKPVSSWPERDEAWVLVARGLRQTVGQILARRAPVLGAPVTMHSTTSPAAEIGGVEDVDRTKVFISHTAKDQATADALAQALESAGVEVCGPSNDLAAGVLYAEDIARRVRESDAVIALWSGAAAESEWVRRESSLALSEGKLLPLRIENVEPPSDFAMVQAIDLIGWQGEASAPALQDLIAALPRRRPAAARPLPSAPSRNRGIDLGGWWRRWRERREPTAPRSMPTPSPVPPVRDEALDALLAKVREPVSAAARERGLPPPDASALDRWSLQLIDRTDAPRILWVDDRPEGNLHERAALARLQVEVVCVTSTGEALAHLTVPDANFDLVLSDWSRPLDGMQAGLALARRMREAGLRLPLVYYHGEFDATRRAVRRREALAAGAAGEAVLPQELLETVAAALLRPR